MSEIEMEEIQVTGTLLNITLFQDKLMKNFLLISNKLRRLEGLLDMDQKQKALQKQFKFLTMKVDTLVQKMPKDSGSLTKNDAKLIAKETLFETLNSNEEKLKNSKFYVDLFAQISKVKEGLSNVPTFQSSKDSLGKKEAARTSFTAGQILKENQKEIEKQPVVKMSKQSKQSLQEVLNQKQMEMLSQIVEAKVETKIQNKRNEQSELSMNDLNQKIEALTKIVEELQVGRGLAYFVNHEVQKMQKFQKFQQKSRQTARRQKQRPIELEGIKAENVRGQILKKSLMTQMQKVEMDKEQIARFQLMQKKTLYANFPKSSKDEVNKDIKQLKEGKDLKEVMGFKERDPYVSSFRQSKDKQGFKRSQSIRKLDKLEKRLKVDDLKELNGVLRQIQLRIQSKVSHDIFMGFVKDIQQKLEALRLARDSNNEVNDIRKNLFILQSKVQSVIAYIQGLSQEDEALVVKKQWACVSCDKGLQKYQGKVGQHLNWEAISSKRMSPTKVGAFGQTGQLAAKIRNLMEGNQSDQ